MVLGYFDAKRMLYGLEGRAFYLDAPESEIYYFNRLLAEAPELLADIWPELNLMEVEMNFDSLIFQNAEEGFIDPAGTFRNRAFYGPDGLLPQIYRRVVSQAGKGIAFKR